MGRRNKKAKTQLDKYYYLAKEQGYRARAAFKLIQLNRRYDFLSPCEYVVDLCAAPGSWLQVCRKFARPSCTVIGIDLNRIKNIHNVTTLVGDITHRSSLRSIRHALRHHKANVVLHDGAPNVGANWIQDAYTQNELVLASVRVCTEVLCPNGVFVTKVFRSRDYLPLCYCLKQFFHKVEATKPPASRNTSAEIYLVCLGYKDPKRIDPKLLDPNHVFAATQADVSRRFGTVGGYDATRSLLRPSERVSLKQYLRRATDRKGARRFRRDGYAEDYTTFYYPATAHEFVVSERPIQILVAASLISFDGDKDQLYASQASTTPEIRTLCEDLKLIGRPDFRRLLKWRGRMRRLAEAHGVLNAVDEETEESPNPDADPIPVPVLGEDVMDTSEDGVDVPATAVFHLPEIHETEDADEKLIEKAADPDPSMMTHDQLEDEIARMRRRAERQRDKLIKRAIVRRHGRMPTPNELFERGSDVLDTMEQHDEALFALSSVDSKDALEEVSRSMVHDLDPILEASQKETESEEARIRAIENEDANFKFGDDYDVELESEFDAMYEKFLSGRSRHMQLRDKEADQHLEEERQHLASMMHEERAEAIPEMPEEPDAAPNPLVMDIVQKKTRPSAKQWFSQDLFEEDLLEMDAPPRGRMPPPSDSGAIVPPKSKRRKLNTGGSVLVPGGEDMMMDVDDAVDEITEVPVEMYDPEVGARTLAVAKKMLRRKERTEYIDGAFNRYAHNDVGRLPKWFQNDFNVNTRRELPATQEEVAEMKRRYEELNLRPIRKVAEAQFRRRRKAAVKRKSMIQRANRIAARDDLPNTAKIGQLQKLYSSYYRKTRRRKIYRTPGQAVKRRRGAKVVFVDNRMKTDKRAAKARKARM